MAISKLKMMISLASSTFDTPNVSRGIQDAMADWRDLEMSWDTWINRSAQFDFSVRDLPSINREMRIILGQLPGMREVMRTYFNIKRLIRPIKVEDGVLQIERLQLALALIATAVMLANMLINRQKAFDRRQREQEALIRRERGLTVKEYDSIINKEQNYFRSIPG